MSKVSPTETSRRFLEKLDRPSQDGCWLWKGYINQDGYGRTSRTGASLRTHRLAYELLVGPIPDGMMVLHHCDVRPCCNPLHLFLGTNQDNMRDMVAKGRHVTTIGRGEENPKAKFTEDQVKAIRRRYLNGETISGIAVSLGAPIPTVGHVVRLETWKHI